MTTETLFKIIYIVLAIAALVILYASVRLIIVALNSKNLMYRDIEMYKIKYSENEILYHLDFIITECLDYYIAINLTPKQLYYINNKIETEIITKLGEMVPSRISPTLYSQLSLIYDNDQIASVIGEKIYTKVLEYVIEFNVQNDNREKNKRSN